MLVDRLRADHHKIYDAIASGEGQLAADLVESHIRSAHASLGLGGGSNDRSDGLPNVGTEPLENARFRHSRRSPVVPDTCAKYKQVTVRVCGRQSRSPRRSADGVDRG